LWLLWVYVLWPVAAPGLAAGLGFVSLTAVLVLALDAGLDEGPWRDRLPLLADAAVGLGFFVLYLSTLAQTILPADSGEFQIVGPLLGVAHPPGYALFTMLAKLFSLLPLGEVAWRLNLMGAVTGALTLVIVARTARRIAVWRGSIGGAWAGLAAAGALGVSTTFWAQSTTVNIRMLSILFVALCLYFLVRVLDAPAASPQGKRALTGLAVSWGLAVAHTAWPVFFAPVFGAVILWHDPALIRRVRQWPRLLLAFLLPFVSDLYIVLRAITGAPFGTDELVDAGRVVDHLLGRGFGGDMFAYLRLLPSSRGSLRFLGERFMVMGNIFQFQFHLPLLIVAGLGFILLARRRGKVALLLGGLFATMAFIVATYRAPQSVEYLMPAYLPIALSIGHAVSLVHPRPAWPWAQRARNDSIQQRRRDPAFIAHAPILQATLLAVLVLPILLLGQANLPSYRLLHGDRSAREYAEGVLLDAPPDAHILANWHWYTPLRYLQLVEGRRPDVEITYLYPQGATPMPQAWPQRIVQEVEQSKRPLIVTNYYPTYADLSLRFEPLGEAFLVRAEPADQEPPNLVPLGTGRAGIELYLDGKPAIRVLGYCRPTPEAEPGGEVSVDLVWQPLVHLDQGYSLFVHLVGENGVPVGQRDRGQVGAHDVPGEVRVDRFRFPVHLSASPGEYRLIAGAYVTADDGSWQRMTTPRGEDILALSDVSVDAAPLPAVTSHPVRVPYVGAVPALQSLALLGVDYDDTLPDQRRVYLHWRAGREPVQVRLWTGGQVVAKGRVPAAEQGYVTTALDVPPGARDLRLEVQRLSEARTVPRRGMWGVLCSKPVALPDPGASSRYVPFGAKMVLVDAQLEDEWQVGRDARVALRFVSQQPIVGDYVVSVGVLGEANTDAPSDWVPALGAIPTFKWVRGARVRDVHLIQVLDGPEGEVEISVGVYDAFTAAALPPLDERIARLGRTGVGLGRVRAHAAGRSAGGSP
jgi:hypothetical protein